MRAAVVSARVLTGEHVRFALVEHNLRPSSLVCPIDDRAHDEAAALCATNGWPLEDAPSIVAGAGLERVLAADVIVLITDGNDYVCAQVAKRAEHLGRRVVWRVVPWQQRSLDV